MLQFRNPFIGDGKFRQIYDLRIQPFAVRLAGCIFHLQILIIYQLTFHRIHQEHPARPQSVLAHHMRGIDIDGAYFRSKDHVIVIGDIITGRPKAVSV